MTSLPRRTGLAVLALVSASLVAVEVLLTRLLSVTTWYGLAFLVLSLAMVGLTRGSLVAMRAREDARPLRPWIAHQLLQFAAGLFAATTVAICVPLTFAANLTSFAAIFLVAAAITLPMISAGSIVARLMAESDAAVHNLYAVDLIAAAGGALAPLIILGPLSAPAALIAVAALLAAAAIPLTTRNARGLPIAVCAMAVCVVGITRGSHAGLELKYLKGTPRDANVPVAFEAWNALSYVSMNAFLTQPFPRWSPSPNTAAPALPVANAYIDGEAGTPVYAWRELADLEPLRSDAITTAHVLRPDGTACVIGVGGGRDLAAARLFGHDRVLGIEINPSIVRMLEVVSPFSPILADPRVRVVIGDGRAVIARTSMHCRVLQASLVDTWAATGAGAFAHTEATLYTREAWAIFLRRVEPDGILTFSRWYDPRRASETSRLVSLAMASLIDRGVEHPRDHIALIAAGTVATILVSPAPFTPEDLAALSEVESRYRYDVLFAPGREPRDAVLNALLRAETIGALSEAGESQDLDTSPPSDDKPFFFHLLAARAWLHPSDAFRRATAGVGVLAGNATATLELLMTFLAVAILGVVLLGPTLARAAREAKPPLPGPRATVYFGALGAGFMMAEIALVQRMHVVLGHPTYALVVVLAGLLVATGVGSAISARVIRSRRSVSAAALLASVLLAALPFAVIRPLAHATIDSPFGIRVAWTGACAAIAGLVLGLLFPAGLRFVSRTRGAPVALAVNGITSVLGSVTAILVSVWAGIPASFVLAGAIYAIAALAGPAGWREVASDDDSPA